MPKAKNEKLQHDVEAAAWALFLEKGYDATSYRDIARAAGTTRANVQYCAQHKSNLVLGLMEQALQRAEDFARMHLSLHLGTYEMLFAIAQISFTLAFADEGFRLIALDTLRNRDLTDDMLQLDLRWPSGHIASQSDSQSLQGERSSNGDGESATGAETPVAFERLESPRASDLIFMEMGGFYELLYRHLKQGTDFDYKGCLKRVLVTMAEAQGLSGEDLDSVRNMEELDDAFLREACRSVRAGMVR